MNTMGVVAIHVDGGANIGLGHATRGIGLAEACRSLGADVCFLIAPESGLSDFLVNRGQEIVLCEANVSGILQMAKELNASALIIDSYRFDGDALRSLYNQGIPVICFDDQANRSLPVDMVINGSPAAPTLAYDVLPTTKLLLDVPYQVVRPEFLVDIERDYDAPVQSLFVSIGGSDLLGIFDPLLAFLSDQASSLLADITVNFVVGHLAKVGDRPSPPNIHLHHSPKDMRSLMAQADLAISAGGQTLYELARCGTPTIAFCVGENQMPNLTSLEKYACISYIGWANDPSYFERLKQQISLLLSMPEQRKKIGNISHQLIDGKGAQRIAEAMSVLIAT